MFLKMFILENNKTSWENKREKQVVKHVVKHVGKTCFVFYCKTSL